VRVPWSTSTVSASPWVVRNGTPCQVPPAREITSSHSPDETVGLNENPGATPPTHSSCGQKTGPSGCGVVKSAVTLPSRIHLPSRQR
jgi:hypothetical protein